MAGNNFIGYSLGVKNSEDAIYKFANYELNDVKAYDCASMKAHLKWLKLTSKS